MCIVSFINDIIYNNEASHELSLHYDNSIKAATKYSRQVQQPTDYFKTIGNPYMSGDIVTQEEISTFDTEYLLYYLSFGKKLFHDFN